METGAGLVGFIAGAIMSPGLIFQVVRVYKLRSAREISLPFTALMISGFALWIVYGALLGLSAVIVWNGVSLAEAGLLLLAKLKWGRARRS